MSRSLRNRQIAWSSARRRLALLLAFASLHVDNDSLAETIRVTVSNAPTNGHLMLLLFDSANAFGDFRDPITVARFAADPRRTYALDNVEPGEYALVVFDDENDNKQIDRTFIGIPRERLAFSNGYQTKGPPSYERAAFRLAAGESIAFDTTLQRPLGELGRVGFGFGVVSRSSPYRESSTSRHQVIPALTYIGNRIQVYGPRAQVGLIGDGRWRLALTATYRFNAYDESDSVFFEGLGDRRGTLMFGPAVKVQLPGGVGFTANYQHDILDRIGGGSTQLGINKQFQFGSYRLTPSINLKWISAELANHDFGVPQSAARDNRPAYAPGSTTSVEPALSLFKDITTSWLAIVSISVDLLANDVSASPLVDDDYTIQAFSAVTYIY
ncbi:MAG: MipA/OmpV family protein [Verrucomicrobia bacterium]|nr:MipA/OmpV family protein [Verrucomicrobiota bacterium]